MAEQMTIWSYINVPYKIDKPIRLIEMFAGIGSQYLALKRLGANVTAHRVIEFDKYAISSYNAIHGTAFEPADIRNVHAEDLCIENTDRFTYLLTYSFPCQDLSNAGKQAGMKKGAGTRSGLLWEVERILNECEELPQVLLMENVPQVHGNKNAEDWNAWLSFLESKGYSNFWKDLNAKDYGIAQNRNRCFMVSLLGEHTYQFPGGIELDNVMADYLDDEVDEKYYVNSPRAQELIDKLVLDGTLGGGIDNRCECKKSLLKSQEQTPSEPKIEESVTEGRKIMVYANYGKVDG